MGRPPCLTDDRCTSRPSCSGESSRRGVAPLLCQPRVAGDVQEAHRRRMLEAAVQAGGGQLHLQAFDDGAGPGLCLLEVVHPEDGLLGQDAHPIREVGPEDLVGPLARRDGRHDDLGSPPGRLRLGHAAQAVALDPEQSLAGRRIEPGVDLRLDERGIRQLIVADQIVRTRRRRTGSLADEHQQGDRDAGALTELGERRPAERREPLIGGFVEEVERDLAAPDGRGQAVERDARGRQAGDHPDAADVTRREPVLGVRREDAQVDKPTQLVDADPGPHGRVGDLVSLHAPTVAVSVMRLARLGAAPVDERGRSGRARKTTNRARPPAAGPHSSVTRRQPRCWSTTARPGSRRDRRPTRPWATATPNSTISAPTGSFHVTGSLRRVTPTATATSGVT